MSITQLQGDSDAVAPEPTGEIVRRLAVEAGKYVGVEAGESLPLHELRQQAEANGYADDEIDGLLSDAGVRHADAVTVPEQGDLLGKLWKPSGPSESAESVESTSSLPDDMARRLEAFREWCARKDDGEDRPHHAYSSWKADKWYARAQDVGRFFAQVHDGPYSTVFISLSLEQQAGESVAEHAGRFWGRTVNRRLRETLKGLGVYDRDDDEVGYAGLRVRAPRLPSGDSPHEQTASAVTHLHLFLWIEGDASGADWDAIRQAHCRLDGAHKGNNPPDDAVKVRVHEPPTIRRSGLPTEFGRNLPCLDTHTDARELSRPYRLWCSELRHGTNESLDSRGTSVVTTLGAFDDVADWMYAQRDDDESGE